METGIAGRMAEKKLDAMKAATEAVMKAASKAVFPCAAARRASGADYGGGRPIMA